MKFICTLALLYFFLFGNAQSSSYKKLNSGAGNSLFRGIVVKSADGGYVTTGDVELYEQGVDNNFVCIIKRNSNGNYEWRYRLDLPYSNTYFYPSMLLQTPDHGYLLGIIEDNYDDYDNWKGYQYIIKLSADGKMKWSQKINIGTEPFFGSYNPIFGIVTKDSSYIVTACRTFEENFHGANEQRVIYAVKIKDNGYVIWLREYFNEEGYWQPTGIVENNDKTFTIGLQTGLFNISESGQFLSGKLFKKSGFPLGFTTITGEDSSGIYLTGENNILALNKRQEPSWAKRLLNNGFSLDQSAYLWYKNSSLLPDSGCLLASELQSSAGGTSLTRFNKDGKAVFQKRLPVTSITAQSSLTKTQNGYMFYSTDWTTDNIIEFTTPDKICYAQHDNVSVVTDEIALVSFEELVLKTDSAGSVVQYPFIQTEEATYTSLTKLCSTVLPLNILSFTAYKKGNSNTLEWSTADEINTDHFIVQRSTNGIDFTDIGVIKALKNAATKNDYHFTDLKPWNSTNYYRLMIVDKDGSSTFSAIRKVDENKTFDVTLYPNPVIQNILLNFNAQKMQHILLNIYNSEGKLVTTRVFDIMAGSSLKTIEFNNFSEGIYFINIQNEEGERSLKFIKE